MRPRNIFVLLLAFFTVFQAKSSDTLRITIRQADSMFLANNYNLLAMAMNIDAQKAQIIQAKLYPNPTLTAEFNVFDPQHGEILHINKTGQKSFQIDQLFLLGGKRKAQIDLAKTNYQIAELEFQDLVRQLIFQLHTRLYFINEQAFLIAKYNKQLILLDTILNAYEVQVTKGNLPLKDLVRLKGVYLNLNNERAAIFKVYFDEISAVQAIIQTNKVITPIISDAEVAACVKTITLSSLNDTALTNRPDYLITQKNIILAEQYFSFQKKMGIPDVHLYGVYDQRGGAFVNQSNFGFSIPLSLWNRNQGNIKTAEYQLKQSNYNADAQRILLLSEIQSNYLMYTQTVIEYKKTKLLYTNEFETTLKGMSDNFQKGNVSLIEFVDFFEGYNDALAEVARIKIQLATSAELINLSVGKRIF